MKCTNALDMLIGPMTESLTKWIQSEEVLSVIQESRHPQIDKYTKVYRYPKARNGKAEIAPLQHMAAGRRFEAMISEGLSRFLLGNEMCKSFVCVGGKCELIPPLVRGELGEVFFRDNSEREDLVGTERGEFDGLLLLQSGEIVLIEISNSRNGIQDGGMATYRKMMILKHSWPSRCFPRVLRIIPDRCKRSLEIPYCQTICLPISSDLDRELNSGTKGKGSPREIAQINPTGFSKLAPIDFNKRAKSIQVDFYAMLSGQMDVNTFVSRQKTNLYLCKRIYLGKLPVNSNMIPLVKEMLPEAKQQDALEILSQGHFDEIHLTIRSEEVGKCLMPTLHFWSNGKKTNNAGEIRLSLDKFKRKVDGRKSDIFRCEIPSNPTRLTMDIAIKAVKLCRECILPSLGDCELDIC